jgi:hypothetical protein
MVSRFHLSFLGGSTLYSLNTGTGKHEQGQHKIKPIVYS